MQSIRDNDPGYLGFSYCLSPEIGFEQMREICEILSANGLLTRPNGEQRKLARSTILQMNMNPHVIHLVSYCEALYPARPADIIDSSSVIRKAVRVFQQHQNQVDEFVKAPLITDRKKLLVQALFILGEIARMNPAYPGRKLAPDELHPFLAHAGTLHAALEKGYVCAPGIFTEPFRKMPAHLYRYFPGGNNQLHGPPHYERHTGRRTLEQNKRRVLSE